MRITLAFVAIVAAITMLSRPTQAAPPERPVVIVPGIIGSVLSSSDGDVVWGTLGSLRGSRFERLNLLPETGEAEPLVASDMLRSIPLVFGAFEIGLYGELVDFLTGKRGALDALSPDTQLGEYVEGETLFVFAYDWRRSNFANARALDTFIDQNIPEGPFDIIAHSMGGIVTRIMLSGRAPAPLCSGAGSADIDLGPEDLARVCEAVYGPSPDGRWPSAGLGGPYASAERLHTLYEMAVPRYGSVNVASTLSEGWGRLTDILIGSRLELQNVVLSMAAPWELVPTYENCCARGAPFEPDRFAVPQPDPDYWLTLVLDFGAARCPYADCSLREAIARNGLANRAIIDAIMNEGLPPSVEVNHSVIGRFVTSTRETVYVAHGAAGGGAGLSYRTTAKGDGTVHEISARMLSNAQGETQVFPAFADRADHGFITGNDQVKSYLFNTLIEPVAGQVEAVETRVLNFARGEVREMAITADPQVVLPGTPFDVQLVIGQEPARPFDRGAALAARPEVVFAAESGRGAPRTATPLAYNADASLPVAGEFVYDGAGYVLETPGIYEMTVSGDRGPMGRRFVYVVEEEP